MRNAMAVGWLVLSFAAPAWSQSSTMPAPSSSASPKPLHVDARLMQTVTVTGVQPGPGLWKVSNGNHVMWVLGTLTPLPKNMQWQSAQVEQTIAQSQELLELPRADLKVDAGFFSKLALLPSVYSTRKNPGGADLQQILPPEMYARWQVLKHQYIGNSSGIEYWRPILVAFKLYQKALDSEGLSDERDVTDAVVKLAKKHHVMRTAVRFQLVIEHPRDAVEVIKQTNLHDISCLNQTMDLLEHHLSDLTTRANAWSTGDMATLQSLSLNDRHESCVVAVVDADLAQQLGLHDLPERMEATWLTAAQAALARNTQTFAVLPIDKVLSADGFLAQLKAKGYVVQSPDEQDPPSSK